MDNVYTRVVMDCNAVSQISVESLGFGSCLLKPNDDIC